MKNTGVYLKPCIDSILEQTFTDWELIVVDDNSTDESYQTIEEYAQKDQRIILLKNTESGIITALRAAYKKVSGQFITRMDSDDLMTPDKLALMYEQLVLKGKGFVAVGLVHYFNETGLGMGYIRYAAWLNQLTNAASNFSDIYKECTIPSPCWMIAVSDFDKCGGFQPDVYPEDYDLAFRFRQAGFKIASVPKVIHHWRDYGNRTSRTDDNYADNRFLALKVQHFLAQDKATAQPLILWGAGRKGKKIAQLLQAQNVTFQWICNNPKKIGKDIYGVLLESMKVLSTPSIGQVIVAISTVEGASEIEDLIEKNNAWQYFRFC